MNGNFLRGKNENFEYVIGYTNSTIYLKFLVYYQKWDFVLAFGFLLHWKLKWVNASPFAESTREI